MHVDIKAGPSRGQNSRIDFEFLNVTFHLLAGTKMKIKPSNYGMKSINYLCCDQTRTHFPYVKMIWRTVSCVHIVHAET